MIWPDSAAKIVFKMRLRPQIGYLADPTWKIQVFACADLYPKSSATVLRLGGSCYSPREHCDRGGEKEFIYKKEIVVKARSSSKQCWAIASLCHLASAYIAAKHVLVLSVFAMASIVRVQSTPRVINQHSVHRSNRISTNTQLAKTEYRTSIDFRVFLYFHVDWSLHLLLLLFVCVHGIGEILIHIAQSLRSEISRLSTHQKEHDSIQLS